MSTHAGAYRRIWVSSAITTAVWAAITLMAQMECAYPEHPAFMQAVLVSLVAASPTP